MSRLPPQKGGENKRRLGRDVPTSNVLSPVGQNCESSIVACVQGDCARVVRRRVAREDEPGGTPVQQAIMQEHEAFETVSRHTINVASAPRPAALRANRMVVYGRSRRAGGRDVTRVQGSEGARGHKVFGGSSLGRGG
eukprot:625002-Prymnesium_polylepis.1